MSVPAHHVIRQRRLARRELLALLGGIAIACGGPAREPSSAGGGAEASAVATPTPVPPPDPWRIGLHLPVSGTYALQAAHARNGALLAFEEINSRGGVLGRAVEPVFEDAGPTSGDAQVSFEDLIEQQPVAVLGSISNAQVLAISEAVKQSAVPVIFAATAASITRQEIPWFFRVIHTDTERVRTTVRFLRNALQARRISSIQANDESGARLVQIVSDEAEKLGDVELVHNEFVGAADRVLSGPIERARDAGADVLFVNTHAAQTALLIREYRKLELKMPFVSDGAVTSAAVLGVVTNEEANGVYAACAGAPAAVTTPEAQRFIGVYRQRFAAEPDVYATNYYDAAYMLAKAIEASRGENRTAIATALQGITHNGLLYPFAFNEYHDGCPWTVILRLEQKQPRMIQTLRYEG